MYWYLFGLVRTISTMVCWLPASQWLQILTYTPAAVVYLGFMVIGSSVSQLLQQDFLTISELLMRMAELHVDCTCTFSDCCTFLDC